MSQKVEIVSNANDNSICGIIPGSLCDYLFSNQGGMPQSVISSITEQAINILCKCVKPLYSGGEPKISETGLVIGYVQSGKTLSFTSVIALAADNDYKLVIVLAGRDILLHDQTDKRLKKDLGQSKNKRNYTFFLNPGMEDRQDIQTQLENKRKPTLIVTVLKHQKYLNELSSVLGSPKIASAIKEYGVLIIDDEADQASLNTKALKNSKKNSWEKDEYSAIYEGILNLKNSLNYHSYIQYTATPQANLLYDYLDVLSPKWHEVLRPSNAYTGGKVFFKERINNSSNHEDFKYQFCLGERDNLKIEYTGLAKEQRLGVLDLVRLIPNNEVYHPTARALTSAPESLLECLRSFFIHCTIITELKHAELGIDQTSMIIHFHSYTSSSNKAKTWLMNIIPQWFKDYKRDDQTLRNEFEATFIEEEKVYLSGYTFNEIYENLEYVLTNYKIHSVLAGTEEIQWDNATAHILIGGMKLDRGFTVVNLTHTYMPRYSVSNSQADTIQQRCRFFGYKGKYIENCRVFLPKDSICEYADYVTDEEDLRNFLIQHKNLDDFFDTNQTISLSPRLRPTRSNILSGELVSNNFTGSKYFNPLAHSSFSKNINLKINFLSSINNYKLPHLINHGGHNRKHDVFKIPMTLFRDELLSKIQLESPLESLLRKKIMRFLDYLNVFGKGECFVINMSQGAARERKIVSRSIKNKNGNLQTFRIDNPFAGKDQNSSPRWPDDKDLIHADSKYSKLLDYQDELIVQLHTIRISECKDDPSLEGKELFTIAFYFPPALAKRYVALKSNADVN
jgi:hypothetical protein